MSMYIKWVTRTVIVLLTALLGYYVWQGVISYQSVTTAQIIEAQQKEQAQRAQFDRQMQQSEDTGERHEMRGKFNDSPVNQAIRFMRDPGSDAVHMVWFAVSFWLCVEAIKRFAPKMSDSIRQFLRKLIQFLREHHRAIGWLAFGFTSAHSIYFFAMWWFKSYDIKSLTLWSGIASFVPFLLLTIWGEWLERHGRDKSARKVHWAMAMIMIIAMVVHDFGSLGKIFILLGSFVGLYAISQLIQRYTKSKLIVTNN